MEILMALYTDYGGMTNNKITEFQALCCCVRGRDITS